MFKTRITALLGIEYPIIQGGLAHLAYAELAAAVSNAGGLGQISAGAFETPEALRREIAKTRSLTDKPFAINLAIATRPMHHILEAGLEEGISIVSVTGGNPEPYFRQMEGAEVKKIVLVAGVRQARKCEELGAAAVIAVGFEGGGHIGRDDIGTLVLVPRVVSAVKIPVVAAGGIADGRGLVAALALGAEGVEMGTRFVATQECCAHPSYKEALVKAQETDTTVLARTLGLPGRALRNPLAELILKREAEGAGQEVLLPLLSRDSNKRFILEGDLEGGYAWAGQCAGLINDVPPVKDLIERMVAEAREVAQRLGQQIGP